MGMLNNRREPLSQAEKHLTPQEAETLEAGNLEEAHAWEHLSWRVAFGKLTVCY